MSRKDHYKQGASGTSDIRDRFRDHEVGKFGSNSFIAYYSWIENIFTWLLNFAALHDDDRPCTLDTRLSSPVA